MEDHAYKIMIVEDEAVIALRLKRRLKEMGYDVVGIAFSGDEAVEKAGSLGPDLILMDIMTPGKLDGIAAAKILKAENDVPVIFLTAFSEEKIIERAKKVQPYGFILKPFQDREVGAAIEVALYKKKMDKALRDSEQNFKALTENASDGILVAVGDGKHVYANKIAAKITGYTISELLRTTIKDLAHPDDFDKINKRFNTIMSGMPFKREYETKIVRKDGHEVPIEVTSARSKWHGQPAYIVLIRDISERVTAEKKLREAYDTLDHMVKERTLELNNALKTIQHSEQELVQRKIALEKLNKELLDTNKALSVLAKNIDGDKKFLEKKIYEIISTHIMPIIAELQKDKAFQNRQVDLELLKTYLSGLIPSSMDDQHDIFIYLSNQEMRVAAMIKRGLTSPQIASMLNVSLHTIKSHRKNIRKKLKLQNSNINLISYLKSKFRE